MVLSSGHSVGCGCSMILSPVNCSEKMSPYEREGDIEHEGTKEADGGILETTPALTAGVIDTSEYAKLKYVQII